MKILYAIQGTGNGHLSRSMDIIPLLKNKGDVDVVVSGIQGDLTLPFVDYPKNGPIKSRISSRSVARRLIEIL